MRVAAGDRVRARGLEWDVLAVEAAGAQARIAARCAEGDLAGLDWEFLHPFDEVERVEHALDAAAAGSLAAWRLRHMAELLDQDPGPLALLAARPGRVAPEAYQRVPVLRALSMPRPRLLLADGVGLGKTIQACLVAAELMARGRAHRVLIVAPPGPLLRQWEAELRLRFGIRARIVADAGDLRAVRAAGFLGANPFDEIPVCLASLDFAKQDSVLAEIERSSWDLAILDEAHHLARDPLAPTRRRRLAEVAAARADGLLLLTATPHDGDDARFGSLLTLLDLSLADADGKPAGAYRRHVVRRLKAHIRDPETGRPLFRARIVRPVAVGAIDPAVADFHADMAAMIAPRVLDGAAGGDALAFVGLLKRSVSTLAACAATLRTVADRCARAGPGDSRARARALRALRRRAARYGALDAAEEACAAELEAEGMASALDAGAEPALRALAARADALAPRDPKLGALALEIAAIRVAEPDANVLVYTEYADSQAAAAARLRAHPGLAGAVLTIGGADGADARARAAERFGAEAPLVLICTDAMAEGLNLHRRCRHLIHLDLPYNPNRLEQRNGRIDRYGQSRDCEIAYLHLPGTFEERLLLRLIARYERARAALDCMPDTLGATADARGAERPLLRGFAEDRASLLPPEPSPLRTIDRAAEDGRDAAWRAVAREIDRAYAGFDRMAVAHGWNAGADAGGDPASLADAADAAAASARGTGGVDPAAFLRAAVLAAGGSAVSDGLRVPDSWREDADGAPGFDPAEGILRLSPDAFRDSAGRETAWPGWTHPLLGRAAAAARADNAARVAAAAAEEEAVLLTYAVVLRAPRHRVLRRVLAVSLRRTGAPRAIADASVWMALAEGGGMDAARCVEGAAGPAAVAPPAWLPARMACAEAAVRRAAARIADAARARQTAAAAREAAALGRWAAARADAICGRRAPRTLDMFAPDAPEPPWRALADPVERLAAYAAEAAHPPDARLAARQAAAHVVERRADLRARVPDGPPAVAPLGLLLLAPP